MMVVVFSSFTDRRFFVAQKSGAAVTTYLYDQFTDVNGTALQSHTMDVGSGWTRRTSAQGGGLSTYTIQSNKSKSAGGLYTVITADGGSHSDGTLTMDFSVPNSTHFLGGFTFRWSATGAYWIAAIENDGGTAYIAIYEFSSGAAHSRASTNFVSNPQNTTVTMTLVINAASVTLTSSTGESCNYASATFNQTATQHGLFDYQDATYTLPFSYDNFKFTN